MKGKKIDRFFLIIVGLLLAIGVAIFISASLGDYAKNKDLFRSILYSQLVLGLGIGLIGMFICSKINYKFWRKFSLFFFIISILLTIAVFIPGLGTNQNTGATRWISVFGFSFQPVEFLKFGFIIYFASWLSWAKNKTNDFKYKILPLGIILLFIAIILRFQPDHKSIILISMTGIFMLYISGASLKYLLGTGAILVIALGSLVFFTPYLQERVKTFVDPSLDPRGSSYQIQQSLIAIGSGGIFGRGYGQSIQKFNYLPESQGDFIFAVLSEELGFIGAFGTIFLYLLFTLRGFRIANNSPDAFGRLLVSGIVILIAVQSFMHIASVTGVFPLTGVPLVFMSQGGTALMIYLAATGIILNVSKFATRSGRGEA
ncbi:hypothetical protein A2738_01685 [Candidatus Nomurabacteria bacterium RIFCSPHIGHO2_01_FULL_42_15]|uniref:Probable peptidoglycan glycosyltransferase FtsW n=1 Tax=Candidatus Nomurabacteria bacterium RIFCSPHIGHO2_01_FULL_42_15 TaxID=1801742 RepID=A0A1F6VGD3_9BACT|nr:MAG: hypothetical protein A2738_01685 [Candidatus Nomurabacteria bacterium RIFCSPHIGHO2_01_FULL_42_15]OGI93222.1 MAG: hypothetical protein A3A99_00485 [Candidatus Nomurabacteria bacterium RIFCSPLOWO2_01_FULL_41_18]